MKNRIGEKYGKLTIISFDKKIRKNNYWNCLCECGNIKSIRSNCLSINGTISCGCARALSKRITDRVGEVHNHLTIISFDRRQDHRNYWWNCRCICGTVKSIRYHSLKSNSIKSCGCKRMEVISTTNITHGLSKTDEYNIWRGMIKRCTKPNNKNYKYYGAKGITVCDRWLESFENFIEDMGMKPSKKHSIDRINNNGNYEPSNCKWSTYLEQANNKSDNKQVIDTVTNEIYTTISSAARNINMSIKTLHNQLTGRCTNKTNLKLYNDKTNK